MTRNSGSGDVVSDVGNLFTIETGPRIIHLILRDGWMISEFGNG